MNPSGDLFEDIVSFISWAPTVWVACKTQDSAKNMTTKSQDRPWAILPESKLLVNQTACLEEIWGK